MKLPERQLSWRECQSHFLPSPLMDLDALKSDLTGNRDVLSTDEVILDSHLNVDVDLHATFFSLNPKIFQKDIKLTKT